MSIFKKANQKFKNRGDAIMSKGSVPVRSYVGWVCCIMYPTICPHPRPTIDATTAPNGRMVSMNYQDHTCQIDCFAGEASAIYDPCGNLISLVAQTTGVEVWARAVDKNSNATIGIYDPFNMEIPFSAQATINPSYDQPINGPIEFQIPEQRQWALKELLANQTKVNTTLGEMGIDVTIGGDDDCEDDPCENGDCKDGENVWPGGTGIANLITNWFTLETDYYGVDWERTINEGSFGMIYLQGHAYFAPTQNTIDYFAKFGLSQETCIDFASFLFECLENGRITMDCTIIETEDGECKMDCECTGDGGSDKRRL